MREVASENSTPLDSEGRFQMARRWDWKSQGVGRASVICIRHARPLDEGGTNLGSYGVKE